LYQISTIELKIEHEFPRNLNLYRNKNVYNLQAYHLVNTVFEEDSVKLIINIEESSPGDTAFRCISKYLSNLKKAETITMSHF